MRLLDILITANSFFSFLSFFADVKRGQWQRWQALIHLGSTFPRFPRFPLFLQIQSEFGFADPGSFYFPILGISMSVILHCHWFLNAHSFFSVLRVVNQIRVTVSVRENGVKDRRDWIFTSISAKNRLTYHTESNCILSIIRSYMFFEKLPISFYISYIPLPRESCR